MNEKIKSGERASGIWERTQHREHFFFLRLAMDKTKTKTKTITKQNSKAKQTKP